MSLLNDELMSADKKLSHPSFHPHFRAHFNNDAPEKSEMPFRKSDVFHVVDTLHDGVVGAWQVGISMFSVLYIDHIIICEKKTGV